jgi:hypothetical protein
LGKEMKMIDHTTTLMSQREMKMKRIGIVPRRREGAVAGSGVSRDTPEPNMRPKIQHDTRK